MIISASSDQNSTNKGSLDSSRQDEVNGAHPSGKVSWLQLTIKTLFLWISQMMNEHKIPTILIIGAGPGGLTLAHSIQKNLNSFEKKFNIKIFDREISPNDKWQGYHITLNNKGVKSLFNCIPESISSRLHEVVLDNKLEHQEHHSSCLYDHKGNVLFKTPGYQVKNIYEFNKLNNMFTIIVTFRDRLRDLLLEGIDVKWGKKCIGYHEDDDNVWAIFDDGTRERGDLLIGADGIHSPIRKQKIPELKINHLGITQCCVDITPNKELMDRMLSITGNSLCQITMGPKGDCTFLMFRLFPIDSNDNNNETSYYRVSFAYSYPSENHEKNDNWTYKDDELPTSKFPDDENPEFVFNDIKKRIKENRPKGKLTDIFLEFWDLAKSRIENDHEICYPLRRRPLRDIDPGSVDQWETTRVTLLGDAIHAMNPWVGIGTNSAIEDAELLTNALANWSKDNWKEHIRNYELGLRGRGSFYVDLTRTSCIKKHQICDGFLNIMIRNFMFRFNYVIAYIKSCWYGDGRKRDLVNKND
ncbi:FAD/NAD(P)-binding domain-containing protein [Rhizophagus irregularis]|uniref:FAD/NAD(P)-binding domain-containing protein n=1 Tax=Rhizophagus irregularis TaxID=588596 RepID=A0A2I1GHL0_9GLOM|nr:FAD/NAD(P)-binding domain-containing protein [Rhizophagus irregularis]